MKRIPLCILIALLATVSPASPGTKEELARLQSDVLALQNQIRMLEKAFREQTDGLRSLVIQLNDQVGKTNQILGKVTATLDSQTAGDQANSQAILHEIRNLAAKVDDSATRFSALAQQVTEMKVLSKPITQRLYQTVGSEPSTLALSADTIYNEAYTDLIQGNLDMAIEGFTSFMKNFPTNEKADDAQYNIGEAYYNARKLPEAIAAFTRVVNDYPAGDKAASAYFKRGKAELGMQEKDNAIADFKIVAEKYAAAPEASLAKAELDSLGVSLTKPTRTTPARRKP